MRAPVALGIVAAAFVSLALAGWYLHTKNPPIADTATTTVRALPRDSGATVVMENAKGQVITVPDFTYGHPSVEVEDTGITYIYLTQNDDLMELDPRYGIVYASDSSISIGLLATPLASARQAAEGKLRELIPLDDAILCTLKVAVRTADTIDARYAGRELGLSFCPNAVPLP